MHCRVSMQQPIKRDKQCAISSVVLPQTSAVLITKSKEASEIKSDRTLSGVIGGGNPKAEVPGERPDNE